MIVEEIEETVAAKGLQATFVKDDQSAQLILELARRYSFNTRDLFLWANRKADAVYEYGDNPEGWKLELKELLSPLADELFLVISDEEYFPWKVLACRKADVLTLLAGQRYFEYFIFDSLMNDLIFDIHDNALIVFRLDKEPRIR